MLGERVVAGMRLTVELILEKIGSGETVEQLLEGCPRLTREGMLAALSCAAGTTPGKTNINMEGLEQDIPGK